EQEAALGRARRGDRRAARPREQGAGRSGWPTRRTADSAGRGTRRGGRRAAGPIAQGTLPYGGFSCSPARVLPETKTPPTRAGAELSREKVSSRPGNPFREEESDSPRHAQLLRANPRSRRDRVTLCQTRRQL